MWEFLDEYYRRQKIDVNKAPEDIVGDYTLSIKDNRITLRDKDGVEVFARCHPEDVFDVGEGVREAFKYLYKKRKENEKKNIKVGDWVEVVNNGFSYSTSAEVFEENDILHYAARFRYGVSPLNGTKGRVMFITDKNIAVVEAQKESYYGDSKFSMLNCYNAIYLIELRGLRKVAELNV